MVKRNYHRLNYDPWAWKPIAPETAEEKADRKRREAIAAEKRANKKAEKKGFQTFMVTPDKDFAQLVSDNIFMYRPMFGGGYETWGIKEVKEKLKSFINLKKKNELIQK